MDTLFSVSPGIYTDGSQTLLRGIPRDPLPVRRGSVGAFLYWLQWSLLIYFNQKYFLLT